jgi:hypothetical protein
MPLTKNGQTMGIAFVEIPRSIEMLPNNLIKKISTEWRRIPVIEVMERMRSDHANAANGIKYTFGDTSQGIADAWGTTLSWQEAWIPPRVNLPSRLSPELARSLMQNSNYGAFHWR